MSLACRLPTYSRKILPVCAVGWQPTAPRHSQLAPALVLVAQIAAFTLHAIGFQPTAVKCFKLAPTPLFEALKDSDAGYQH